MLIIFFNLGCLAYKHLFYLLYLKIIIFRVLACEIFPFVHYNKLEFPPLFFNIGICSFRNEGNYCKMNIKFILKIHGGPHKNHVP